MNRYYICGMSGSGTDPDPHRPEIADDLKTVVVQTIEHPETGLPIDVSPSWAANQEFLSLVPVEVGDMFVVAVNDPTGEVFDRFAYDAASRPNGYDWFEVADDGTVSIHAK